jgi:hypothetical protein
VRKGKKMNNTIIDSYLEHPQRFHNINDSNTIVITKKHDIKKAKELVLDILYNDELIDKYYRGIVSQNRISKTEWIEDHWEYLFGEYDGGLVYKLGAGKVNREAWIFETKMKNKQSRTW